MSNCKAIFIVHPDDEPEYFTIMKHMINRIKNYGGKYQVKKISHELAKFKYKYYYEYTFLCDNIGQLVDDRTKISI